MNTHVKTPVSVEGYDIGLRSYLTSIYNWLLLGLLISAGAVFAAQASGFTAYLAQGGFLFWAILLAPFALILFMGAGAAGSVSVSAMSLAFVAFTALEGLSVSVVLARYTGASVLLAFVSTAAAFAGLSLWAYTTKRNLTGMGNFFLIAIIGLLVLMVISMFVQSSGLDLIVSAAGVVIFAGLIAYDTQVMRANYHHNDADANARFAIWHALDIYLDFLNLFLFLLRFIGVKAGDD